MPRTEFDVRLPLEEFRDRLRRAFEAQEELIRKKQATDFRGAFTEGDAFWIQQVDPNRPNQWNEALKAAPRAECEADSTQAGATRITVRLKRKPASLAVLAVCAPAAIGLLVIILKALGLFGAVGYVYGLKRTLALSGGALVCVLLGMVGAVLWGRENPSAVRIALLRAVGLFGAGRARFR